MGIVDDRILDEWRGYRTPAYNLGQLVSFETYGDAESSGVGRVIGLVVADSRGYRWLTSTEPIAATDVWGYDVWDTEGVSWLRTAGEMRPLGASGE